MLAPLPATVHVPDETAALPTIPVLPMSRLAQPVVGSADCARTKPALADSAHTNTIADKAPPRICLFSKMPLPVSCRSPLGHSSRHVSAGPKRTCTFFHTAQLSFVSSQADSAGKSAATWTDPRKTPTFTEVRSSRARIKVDSEGSRREQQLHEPPVAQEIITGA